MVRRMMGGPVHTGNGSNPCAVSTNRAAFAASDGQISNTGAATLPCRTCDVRFPIRFYGTRRLLGRTLWATASFAVLLAPIPRSSRLDDSSLLAELSVGTGMVALAVLVATVVLPSRLRWLTRTIGIEGVLGMHTFAGLLVAVLIAAHIALVLAANPANIGLLNPLEAPNRARAATAATAALAILIGLTLLRRRPSQRYELWRWMHVALAGSVLVLSALHIWWLNHLVRDRTMRAWLALLALGLLGVLAYRWLWRPIFAPGVKYVVREIRPETTTVSTLVVEPPAHPHRPGHRTLQFAPGQFAWLRVSPSITAEEHPFTIASSPHTPTRTEFTIRHSGDFTRALRRLRPGDTVWLDGPHGNFSVDLHPSTGLIMIAGGVGITPMISMLRILAHRCDRRPHRLIAVARTVDELLFRAELHQLTNKLDLIVVELLRRPPPGWTGASGAVNETLLTTLLPDTVPHHQLDYYICGPPTLVTNVLTVLNRLNVPLARIHTERFDLT
jgi:predicted ferric reductase